MKTILTSHWPRWLPALVALLPVGPLTAQVAPAAPATPPTEEKTVVLSPFEVTTDSTRGYYASNTMSGTRLNSSIEDLASSITVVTKEQMADFAMLDINDIFLYEAGTEGTGNYTEFSIDRNGSPLDGTSNNPNSANRMRGVGSANISFGNFETSGRVPVDPINIDAVEISRGPNSSIFGLGNSAGTVNMVPATANVQRDRSTLAFRADSYEGYRGSLDLNRVLKKGVLAVRGSAVFQHDGFVRKPSGVDTERLNGMVRYQPFKQTTLIASHSYYRLQGTRPNSVMPRDGITGWRNAGSPTWDPITQTAKINGIAVPGNWNATNLPSYFSNAQFRTLSTVFIDPDGDVGFWSPSRTTSTSNPNTGNQNVVLVNTVPEPIRLTQPLFAGDPSVSSKELYDYSSINLAAMNYDDERTLTTHVQLEQIFINTPRHLLAVQAGWFREDSRREFSHLAGRAGSGGATGFLHVDVNERMIDGSPNPYFLRPFLGFFNVRWNRYNPLKRETTRAQLAYRLDLRNEKSSLRWLGMHQFSGYGEYKVSRSRQTEFQNQLTSSHSWYPRPPEYREAASFTVPAVATMYSRYYVGDANGQNIDYGPHALNYGTHSFTWGNGATGSFVTEPALLERGVAPNGTNGWRRDVLKTRGAVLQSHLFKGRLISTLGLRKDETVDRGPAAKRMFGGPDGYGVVEESLHTLSDVRVVNAGTTKTAGVVVKPTRWLNLHYNVSDSFRPAALAEGLYLNNLPNPTGEGTDYGLSVNLFSGKLVMRLNKYSTIQRNSRNGSNRTLAQRIRGLDFDTNYAPLGLAVQARGWVTNAAAAGGITLTEDQINQRISEITKLDVAYFAREESTAQQNTLIFETEDVEAKGVEFELNYNPTNYWTVKFNLTESESIDMNLSPALNKWLQERLPVWESIIDPELNRPWFTESYGGTVARTFLQNSVLAPLNIANATEGKSRPQIRKYRANLSTSYRLAGLTEQRHLKRLTVGGALRWEDKAAIGYYGVESLPALVTALDPNHPIYEKARLYADAFIAYRTRLFGDKVGATFQLNVRNLQENGRLQAISAYPDGTPNGFRIIDPRQFILTATFDL